MTTTTSDPTTTKEAWDAAAAASAEAEQSELEKRHPPRRFSEMLPVRLTEAEIAERARRASVARRKIAEFEAQKDIAAKHWKTKIDAAEQERDELLDTIDSGVEERAVECVETFEWRTGTVVVSRADTKERIRERAMTYLERQPSLPKVDTTNGGAKAKETAAPPPPLAGDLPSGPLAHDGDEPTPSADDDDVADAYLHDNGDDLDELEEAIAAITPADEADLPPPSSVPAEPAKTKKPRAPRKPKA